jgi:hypothetical protein
VLTGVELQVSVPLLSLGIWEEITLGSLFFSGGYNNQEGRLIFDKLKQHFNIIWETTVVWPHRIGVKSDYGRVSAFKIMKHCGHFTV